jgi:hypothetical protein
MRGRVFSGATTVAAILAVLATSAQATTKTIGPITTTGGSTCYVHSTLVRSTSSAGAPDVTFGSGWNCTVGAKQLSEYSLASDQLNERVGTGYPDWDALLGGGVATGADYNFYHEVCSPDPSNCAQSKHYQSLPQGQETLTSSPRLRSYYTSNFDWSDDDFFATWPASCRASKNIEADPGPSMLDCTIVVKL